MRVVIAGGGIGGLSAAIGLRRVGHEVIVLERASRLEAVGSGISLHSNAMEGLRRLGVADRIREVGAPLLRGEIRRSDGRVVQSQPLTPIVAALGQPDGVAVHRADLQRVLREAFDGEVRTGIEVRGWREQDRVVALHDGGETEGDVLVGADGIHSAIAAQLRGPSEPRYAGYVAWRGLAEVDPPYPEGTGLELAGPGQRFGTVRIGGGFVYWFCTLNGPPGTDGDVRRLFDGWAEPVPTLIDATPPDRQLRNDVLDRPFSPRWGEGRVTLLGDAAHAMTPNMGQGACQAIEDAVVLADALRDGPGGLRRYEDARRARARWFVRTSWWLGWAGQWSSPLAVGLRDAAASLPGANAFATPGLRRMLRFPYDALATLQ